MMKGITLTAPWGTLVAIGAKRIETRSWQTPYRGPLAIHQAKGLAGLHEHGQPWEPKWALEQRLAALCDTDPFLTVLRPHISGYTAAERASDLPRGCIVATARLVDVIPTDELRHTLLLKHEASDEYWRLDEEQPFGDYSPGRYAWLLARTMNLFDGIECKGGRGLWDVPDLVLEEILATDDFADE